MMSDRKLPSNASVAFRISAVWDIYIPVAIAVVPASIFAMLGFVTAGLDKPNAEPSIYVTVAMVVLQTLGIIAMAWVILMRFDTGMQQLSIRSNGAPPIWRKLVLMLSLMFILLFDVLTSLAAALAGAELFLVLAVPAFIMYVSCVRIAFAGL